MAPKIITLIRHGQAHHNVDRKYHLRDPYLTALGESQCLAIPERFPTTPKIDLLVTSPLKRTIQTTILGFSDAIAAGVPLVSLAQLQETSNMPCDTGSDASILAADPMLKTTSAIDFSLLPDGWTSKEGEWAATPDALKARAQWVRRWLLRRGEEHVVCVLHGGFLHYLTDDWAGSGGQPGTGWGNTEFRSYTWAREGEDELVETPESRKRRIDKPLGTTEMKQFVETRLKN